MSEKKKRYRKLVLAASTTAFAASSVVLVAPDLVKARSQFLDIYETDYYYDHVKI